jgi:hypothetical protein
VARSERAEALVANLPVRHAAAITLDVARRNERREQVSLVFSALTVLVHHAVDGVVQAL